MNSFWLTNLSIAIDGTRYVAGVDSELGLSHVDRVTVDASPLGPDGLSPAAFVELLRTEGTDRVDLVWIGEAKSGWATESGFVVVPRPDLGAWRMRSTATMGGSGHGWDSTFILFSVPEDNQVPTVPEASAALQELLVANHDHFVESHRNAALESQQILAGTVSYPASVFGISLAGLEEDNARLLAGAIGIAAGKLSGMGGFDDSQSAAARQFDPVTIVGQAIAASTQGP